MPLLPIKTGKYKQKETPTTSQTHIPLIPPTADSLPPPPPTTTMGTQGTSNVPTGGAPGTTAPAATSSNGSVKFNPPAVFDGSYKDYHNFIRDLTILIAGYKINDAQTRISLALSFMRGPLVDEFVQEVTNTAFAQTPVDFGSWIDFKRKLDDRFQHKNFAREAREKLEVFRQDKRLVDEYITKLEMLFTDGGLADEAEKIRILEKGLRYDILEVIYSGNEAVPNTYVAYRDKALNIGRMKERFRYLNKITSSTHLTPQSTPSAPSAPPKQHQFITHIHPPAEKKPAPKYEPMDVDRSQQNLRCFGCGEKGHMRRDCPKPREQRLNVRALLGNFEDDELQEVLRDWQEMDFQDGR
jgi:hypothetical protein